MDKTLELIKLAKDGDMNAKDMLVKNNTGLVWAVAKRFSGRGYELDDIYQIGCIGLLKCIDKFDLSYNVKFSTYAVPMITGEIKRFLRDDGMIKVSRSLKENAYKITKLRNEMMRATGKDPGLNEISKILHIETEEMVACLEANAEVESINKTIFQSDGNEISLGERIADENDEEQKLLDKMTIDELMNKLNKQERQIIEMRYFQNKTQTEIAGEIGISQVQVSRMEKKDFV